MNLLDFILERKLISLFNYNLGIVKCFYFGLSGSHPDASNSMFYIVFMLYKGFFVRILRCLSTRHRESALWDSVMFCFWPPPVRAPLPPVVQSAAPPGEQRSPHGS